jgi:hypothetical protein
VAFDKDSFVAKVEAIVLLPTTEVTVSWVVKGRTVTRVLDQVAKKTLVGRIDEVTRDLDASAAIASPPHLMPTLWLDTRDKRDSGGPTLQFCFFAPIQAFPPTLTLMFYGDAKPQGLFVQGPKAQAFATALVPLGTKGSRSGH